MKNYHDIACSYHKGLPRQISIISHNENLNSIEKDQLITDNDQLRQIVEDVESIIAENLMSMVMNMLHLNKDMNINTVPEDL
jgi:hypothetical protein